MSHRNGEDGSIKMFGCFTVCHISAFILKCILLSLCFICEDLVFMQCVVIVLVCLVTLHVTACAS